VIFGDSALAAVYLLGCLVLVASALAVRRPDLREAGRTALIWLGLFLIAFLLIRYLT